MAKTVEFADISEKKKRHDELRRELLSLTEDNPLWWKENNEKTERLQEIGAILGADTMDESMPIKKIDITKFTQAEYRALRMIGYCEESIYKALGLKSSGAWYEWRKSRGFECKFRRGPKVL